MKKTQNNFGFTLVELIVVITILAILGTIAFISLQGYSAQARDSKRLSDIQNIKKSLELFSLNTGKYPEPDDYFTVSYGSQNLRYQGTVGDQVSINLSRNLNEKPTDPLTESEYTYSRTYAGTEYELLSIYESDLMSFNSLMPFVALAKKGYNSILLNQTNAANQNYPKINGNYNGVYVKAGIYYLPTPSIINGNIWGNVDLATETTLLESQVITGGDNVPGVSTGGLDGMSVEIFSGTLDTDKGQDEGGNKALLAQALISAYSGTILASGGVYKEIVETSSEDYVSLVDNFVLNSDNFVNSTSNNNGGGGIIPDWDDVASVCGGASNGDLIYESTNLNDDTGLTCEHDIAVCSGDGTGYIISSCNLGATTVSTDWEVSGGEYFQWGRNKGFIYGDDTQQSSPIPNASYDPNNDTYGFVWNPDLNINRYDWIDDQDDDLWGNTTDTNEARQGPCSTGYHVPSHAEWVGIINVGDGILWDMSGTEIEGIDLKSLLKLPFAGLRHRSDGGGMVAQGTSGFYWSSSPDNTHGFELRIDSNRINPSNNDNRAFGFSVRCFKN